MKFNHVYEYGLCPPTQGGLLSVSHCQTGAEKRLKERLELNSPATQAQRHTHFQIPGTEPNDYRELVIPLDSKRSVCVGIRHLNLEPNYPFLDVWPNWHLMAVSDLETIADAVTPKFAQFKPRALGLWLTPPQTWTEAIQSRVSFGQHILVARYADIQSEFMLAPPPGFMIQPLSSEQSPEDFEKFYMEYAAEYAAFHLERPDLKDRVPIVDRTDLEPSIRTGLTYEALLHGQRIGLIAARREDLAGNPGIYFLEILTYRAHRGKGLAPHLQRQFIETITRRFGDQSLLFWGTIDSKNQSSLRTAERVGRKIVSTEYFFELPLGHARIN